MPCFLERGPFSLRAMGDIARGGISTVNWGDILANISNSRRRATAFEPIRPAAWLTSLGDTPPSGEVIQDRSRAALSVPAAFSPSRTFSLLFALTFKPPESHGDNLGTFDLAARQSVGCGGIPSGAHFEAGTLTTSPSAPERSRVPLPLRLRSSSTAEAKKRYPFPKPYSHNPWYKKWGHFRGSPIYSDRHSG